MNTFPASHLPKIRMLHNADRLSTCRAWALNASMVLGLTACGGGGSSPAPAPAPAPAVPATATFTTVVVDANGAPVNNATVTVVTPTVTYTDTTDATGNYSVAVDPATVPTPSATTPILVTVTAPGYGTVVLTYTDPVLPGGSYGVPGGGSTPVTLPILGAGEYSPAEGAGPIHLGDGLFPTSTENSQFQAPVSGTRRSFNLGSLTGLNLSSFSSLQISLAIKGLQVTSCPTDGVNFFQSTSTDGSTARSNVQAMTVVDSPLNGSYADQVLTVSDISALNASLGNLWVEVVSGPCPPSDLADDFEFNNVQAKFLP